MLSVMPPMSGERGMPTHSTRNLDLFRALDALAVFVFVAQLSIRLVVQRSITDGGAHFRSRRRRGADRIGAGVRPSAATN